MNDCPNIINQNHIEFACQKILCVLCVRVCGASKLNVAADEFVGKMERNETKQKNKNRGEKILTMKHVNTSNHSSHGWWYIAYVQLKLRTKQNVWKDYIQTHKPYAIHSECYCGSTIFVDFLRRMWQKLPIYTYCVLYICIQLSENDVI